jgi:hypothetical protein
VWENKAILFLTDVVLSMRQVRPQKLPRAEAIARKRKMAAARQTARRCRLRQAEKEAGGRAEGRKEKEKTEEAEAVAEEAVEVVVEELELEDVGASEGDLVEVTNPSL